MDTVAYAEFSRWRLQPTMEMTSVYFTRIQQEDIQPCLNFKNTRVISRQHVHLIYKSVMVFLKLQNHIVCNSNLAERSRLFLYPSENIY